MKTRDEQPQRGPSGGRRRYRRPRLKVHGDVRRITAAKAGTRNDGWGKPRTRASGGKA